MLVGFAIQTVLSNSSLQTACSNPMGEAKPDSRNEYLRQQAGHGVSGAGFLFSAWKFSRSLSIKPFQHAHPTILLRIPKTSNHNRFPLLLFC
jgi:hypothetical protein